MPHKTNPFLLAAGAMITLAVVVVSVTFWQARVTTGPREEYIITDTATPSPFPTHKVVASITPLYFPPGLTVTPLAAYVGNASYDIPGNIEATQPYMSFSWWNQQVAINNSLLNQYGVGNNSIELGHAMEATGDKYFEEGCYSQAYGSYGLAIVPLHSGEDYERLQAKMHNIEAWFQTHGWQATCVNQSS